MVTPEECEFDQKGKLRVLTKETAERCGLNACAQILFYMLAGQRKNIESDFVTLREKPELRGTRMYKDIKIDKGAWELLT